MTVQRLAGVPLSTADEEPQSPIVTLNSPDWRGPLHHELSCKCCLAKFSHSNPAVLLCGLCRMDEVNASYRRKDAHQ